MLRLGTVTCRIFWVVAAVACAPSIARAAPSSLREARKAYEKFEYDKILPLLEQAKLEATNPEEEVEVYAFIGEMQVIYDQMDLAIDAFMEVLERDPSYQASELASPKILTALEEAKKRVLATEIVATPAAEAEPPAVSPATEIVELPPIEPIWKKWWLWTAVGVGVAAIVVTGVMVSNSGPSRPNTDFGPEPLF